MSLVVSPRSCGDQGSEISVPEPVGLQPEDRQRGEQCVASLLPESQPGDAGAVGVGDGVGDGVQGLGATDRIMAESLDAQQAVGVGVKADLPQRGGIGQPFTDVEVPGVVDRGFRSKGASFAG